MTAAPLFTALDLFCGCGGLSLGFQLAGFRIAKAFDAWPCALATYNANFDHPAEAFDLSETDAFFERIGNLPFNAVIGGPPCQDFSSAGRRQESDKADLTLAFARIVTRARPPLFVMENVSAARASRAYASARHLFKEAGYGLTETVLNASYCGAPQARKRFFCVGLLNAPDSALEKTLAEAQSSTPMTLRRYFGAELDVEHYYRHPRNYSRRAVYSVDEPSATIRGVSRPVPEGYKGHPKDSAPLSPALRPLTTAERARVQTFPAGFRWLGSKTEIEQMIGNAVPVNLAKFTAEAVIRYVSRTCFDATPCGE